MSTYNERKEPTFNSPARADLPENATESRGENVAEKSPEKAKVAFSLHTKKAPGYTFTPVMKRPQGSQAELSTIEEQAAQPVTQTTQPLNEQTMNNTNEPKTTQTSSPKGFAFAPVAEENTAAQPAAVEPEVKAEEKNDPPKEEKPSAMERVLPAAAPAAAKAAVEKVPSKYRRLLIVLLLLLALLLAFFLLKPKAPESVEALQQQGTSLPIEFRPVDEAEAKRAEEQAKALQAQQEAEQQAAQQQVDTQGVTSGEQIANPTAVEANNAPVVQADNSVVSTNEQPAAVEYKPVVQEPVKKPATSGSVIYQPETANKSAAKAAQATPVKVQTKSEPAKVQPKVETVKVQAKPAPQPKPVAAKAEPATVTSNTAIVSSKTLTVPKGVSLMQVFRDNKLNISDVNAMSKVNNIVSNLKVGEKVTVRLDKNGRVAEMNIGSGGKFIRQANGTYIYK